MLEAEARIATTESSRYLTELAEAWVHTYSVRFDAMTAEVALPGVELAMTADGDSLSLRLAGSDEGRFEAAKQTVVRHVDRIAMRDTGVRCLWHDIP